MNSLHVVLGAGQIGSRLAKHLTREGHPVRLIKHSEGDIRDLAFAEEATRGAAVVYDCMNPPYHLWPEQLVAIGTGAVHGARKAGAKLVALDCLYMYGRPAGLMTESSPMQPCSRKGGLRVKLAEMRLASGVDVAIARASDFFGPDVQLSAWGDRFFERIYAGKPGECMGDPDMPHSYTYVDDVVRALAALGHSKETGIWHIPTAPAESTRALAERVGHALGLEVEVSRVPKLLLRAVGVFNPFLREAVEMTYQWEVPYILDSTRFERTFGIAPTPLAESAAATAEWARANFGPAPPPPHSARTDTSEGPAKSGDKIQRRARR